MDSIAPIAPFGIGTATPRFEDARLLRGQGRYTDDIHPSRAAHMIVLRSPHAHATIRGIDTTKAATLPGVLTILTAQDLAQDNLGTLQTIVARNQADGSPMPRPTYRLLALEKVRLVGDPVAIVIADTLNEAQAAAEAIEVDYDSHPAVTDIADAILPGAPQVWPSLAPSNICFFHTVGDKTATDSAFEKAPHVATLDFRISRVSANPIEPRNCLAEYHPGTETYTLHAGMQAPHKMRFELATQILGIAPQRLRIVSPDMGGAFGMKGSPYPEYALALWAARRTARPIRWNATRSESLLSDYHARDNVSTIQLALDENGIFLALRIRTLAALGAYLGYNAPHASTNNLGGLAGVYRTPHIHAEVTGVFTHTQTHAPYRGAGRPEATFAIERIIDVAAAQLGLDRVEIRRRNLIAQSAMPWNTKFVFTYDSGDFASNMDKVLEAADWHGFPARRATSEAQGKLRGIGIANAIEIAGGPAKSPNEEGVEIRFDAQGDATILLGTHNHGQGHETAFRQIAATSLGLDPARIRILQGDTDVVAHGRGTFGSRSIMAGGTAFHAAAEKIIERGKTIAAHLLEAATIDIAFDRGFFSVAGTDRAIRIEAVAQASYIPSKLPPKSEWGLGGQAIVAVEDATFPNGCHVCEVEIDPETGAIDLLSYTVVDDVGTVINPLLVKGQIHGGIAQGLGQILMEQVSYDKESGQMLSGSFMDYAMPRASDIPAMDVHSNPHPTTMNPLGAKGAGEAGTVGALPAITSAIVDALHRYGITHIDMPATPQTVWSAIRTARDGKKE